MSDEVMKKIIAARTALLEKHPFFGVIAVKLNPQLGDEVKGCDVDGTTIRFNPDYADAVTHEELMVLWENAATACALNRTRFGRVMVFGGHAAENESKGNVKLSDIMFRSLAAIALSGGKAIAEGGGYWKGADDARLSFEPLSGSTPAALKQRQTVETTTIYALEKRGLLVKDDDGKPHYRSTRTITALGKQNVTGVFRIKWLRDGTLSNDIYGRLIDAEMDARIDTSVLGAYKVVEATPDDIVL